MYPKMKEAIGDGLEGHIITAVVNNPEGKGLMQNVIGSPDKSLSAKMNTMFGACISDGVSLIAVHGSEGIHVFKNIGGEESKDAVLVCHHATKQAVRLLVFSGNALIFVENENLVVLTVGRQTRPMPMPMRQVISLGLPIVAADHCGGSTWILYRNGDVALHNQQSDLGPAAIDPTIVPLGILTLHDGLRAIIVGALRGDNRLVYIKCRINVGRGCVSVEPAVVELAYTWSGDDVAACSGGFALMCSDDAGKMVIVLSTRHQSKDGDDVVTGRLRFLYANDMERLLGEPVTSVKCHSMYYTDDLASVTLCANNRLIAIASIVKRSEEKGQVVGAPMMMRYSIHMENPTEVLSVLLTKGAGPMDLKDAAEEKVGTSLVDTQHVCQPIIEWHARRAKTGAQLARSLVSGETGSSFTTGAVARERAKLEGMKKECLKANNEASEWKAKYMSSQTVIANAAEKQAEMAKHIKSAEKALEIAEREWAILREKQSEPSVSKAEQNRAVEAVASKWKKKMVEQAKQDTAEFKKKMDVHSERHAAKLAVAQSERDVAVDKAAKTVNEMRREISKNRQSFALKKQGLSADVEKANERAKRAEESAAEANAKAAVLEKRLKDAGPEKVAADAQARAEQEVEGRIRKAEQEKADMSAQVAANHHTIQSLKMEVAQLRQANTLLSANNSFWRQILTEGMMPDGTPVPLAFDQLQNLHAFQSQIATMEIELQTLVRKLAGDEEGTGAVKI